MSSSKEERPPFRAIHMATVLVTIITITITTTLFECLNFYK